jgi:membrane protein implicated in regulation of membrane protease activity
MTTTQIIIVVAIVAAIAILVTRWGGPRVTTIDRKTQQEKELEDRDDA